MEEQQKSPVAAPADSASHMGTYTVPTDVQRVPELEDAFPETNQDVNPKREIAGYNWPLTIGVVLVLLIVGLWIGRYMIL